MLGNDGTTDYGGGGRGAGGRFCQGTLSRGPAKFGGVVPSRGTRAEGCLSAEGCHTHFCFQLALLMGLWQQFCDHIVATVWRCNFGVLCMFVLLRVCYYSHSGIGHFELW